MKQLLFKALAGLALLVTFNSCAYHEVMDQRNQRTQDLTGELDYELERGKKLQR